MTECEEIGRPAVQAWMEMLKRAWEAADVDAALVLFERTERYFERPFSPGTSKEDYRGYWNDVVSISDIVVAFEVVAVDGLTGCVRYDNWFTDDGKRVHLNGMFEIVFFPSGECREFRQWWFMEP